jgi:FlgN protein
VSALIAHLERQIESSRRLLKIVLSQGESIRRQDVEGVLARLADVQTEMAQRARIELERDDLLRSEATRVGVAPETLDLEAMLAGRSAAEGIHARALSGELKGLLAEIGNVHDQNRVLLRQELSFLDHLLRVVSGSPQGGYSRVGWSTTPSLVSAVDARA